MRWALARLGRDGARAARRGGKGAGGGRRAREQEARGSLTGAPIAVSSGVSLGGGAARAALAFSALFLERIQRLSTWPAMLPGPSKKDCDELAESTCMVKGGGVRTPEADGPGCPKEAHAPSWGAAKGAL